MVILAKKGTSDETAQTGPDVEEATFGKDFSSLRMALMAATVAIGLVSLGLLVLRRRKRYRRRLCRKDLLAGLGRRKRKTKGHGVGHECGSRGTARAYRIVLCLWSLSRRTMVRDIYG